MGFKNATFWLCDVVIVDVVVFVDVGVVVTVVVFSVVTIVARFVAVNFSAIFSSLLDDVWTTSASKPSLSTVSPVAKNRLTTMTRSDKTANVKKIKYFLLPRWRLFTIFCLCHSLYIFLKSFILLNFKVWHSWNKIFICATKTCIKSFVMSCLELFEFNSRRS